MTLRARWVTLRARWVDAESSLGDTESSLGNAKSSLGNATISNFPAAGWAEAREGGASPSSREKNILRRIDIIKEAGS
jgi:hypothetical protein